MPKTKVILTSNIVNLGGESDQVRVAAGYARNYLFPQGLAIPLTQANKRRIESLKQRRAEREAHEFNTMTELAKGVAKLVCVIQVKTGDDGKMFGAVTAGTIADQLKNQFDILLEKRKIHLEHPIRSLGDHDVELKLHTDVNATLKVRVESSTPLPQTEPPAADARKEERTEHRGRRRETTGEPAAQAGTTEPSARGQRPARPARAPRPAREEKPVKGEKPAKTAKP